jgi:radial spoke head protein 4A
MMGTNRDYWVVSGTLNQVEEANADKMVEARGTGVNTHVYWVTNNLLSDWI